MPKSGGIVVQFFFYLVIFTSLLILFGWWKNVNKIKGLHFKGMVRETFKESGNSENVSM